MSLLKFQFLGFINFLGFEVGWYLSYHNFSFFLFYLVTRWVLSFVKIWVLTYFHTLSFWFVTIWVFELSQLEFRFKFFFVKIVVWKQKINLKFVFGQNKFWAKNLWRKFIFVKKKICQNKIGYFLDCLMKKRKKIFWWFFWLRKVFVILSLLSLWSLLSHR